MTDAVIGAAVAVHRELGSGFLESTYQRAMAIELRHRGLAFEAEFPVELFYRGQSLGEGRIDLLVENTLVVELKAVSHLTDAHTTQVLAYLKAKQLPLGLLINFHENKVVDGVRRIAN